MINNSDTILKICMGMFILSGLLILVAIMRFNDLKAQKIQELMPGCIHLVSEPRDLNDLHFFDCNGTIVIKRYTK